MPSTNLLARLNRRCWFAAAAAVIVIASILGAVFWPQPRALLIPTVVDLGSVGATRHRRNIHIQNNTRSPIRITDIKSGCGCTVASFKIPLTLEPGAGADGEVALDATGKRGHIEERIAFYTDRPSDLMRIVAVRAFVKDSAEPRPQPTIVMLGRFGDWESPARTVRIVSGNSMQLKILGSGPGPGGSQVEVIEQNPGFIALKLTIQGSSLAQGTFVAGQVVRTTQGDVRFELQGEQAGPLYAPEKVVVARAEATQAVRKVIRVRHKPAFPVGELQVASAEWHVGCVRLDSLDASTTDLTLEFSSHGDGALPARGAVSFFLSTAGEPLDQVQVVVLPPRVTPDPAPVRIQQESPAADDGV